MKKMLFCVVVFALLATPSMAAVVFSDTFSDGNRDGWYINNDDAYNDLTVSGGALVLSDTDGTDNYFSAVGNFAAADMSDPGAKITLTLDFQNLENDPYARGLGVGLYDSAGTAFMSDVAIGDTTGADDSGWYLYTRSNPALHRMYENNGHGISYTSGANRANNTTSDFGYADGIWHTYKMTIETAADLPGDTFDDDSGLDLLVTIICDEGLATENSMSYRDTFGLVLNYDEVGIMSMKGLDVEVDNVAVDYVAGTPVPEPATMVLLGLGGLLLRRRK